MRRTALWILVAASCGGEPGPGADGFAEACLRSGVRDRETCECLSRRAEAEFSPDAQRYLAGLLAGDTLRIGELRRSLSVTETMQADMLISQQETCVGGR